MNLIELTFDVNKFATFPKCIGSFQNKDGAGCLLTAFCEALGFHYGCDLGVAHWRYKDQKIPMESMMLMIDVAAIKLLGPNRYRYANSVVYEPTGQCNITWGRTDQFTSGVIGEYDYGNPVDTLMLVWKLIDEWPNKTGFAGIEDVVMPETCKV